MSKLILVISIFSLLSANILWGQKDRVVMTINGNEITESEFLQVFLKNNNDPQYDQESMDEYIELFVNYKLKVNEALELKYDTITSVKRELRSYKEQLARPYLVDSAKNEEIVREAYNRYLQDVDASHILIKVDKNASAEDTIKAYNKIAEIRKNAKKSNNFGKLAKKTSEDESAQQNLGRLGYFTAFQMVYPFENAAYNTKVGEISEIIRTRYGYHILKVHDKREARGTITTAHIMVGVNKASTKEEKEKAEKKINEIYEKLEEGEDFVKLVKLYSDDTGTKNRGGRLPAFGAGTSQRMVPEFEDAAFELSEDGAYSKPFQTDYGYHIVKRISYEPVGSYEDLKKMLQNKVNKGERGQKTQKYFVEKLKDENSFRDRSKRRLITVIESIDSSVYEANWESPEYRRDKWLFKYNGEDYTMSDFAAFIESKQMKTAIRPPFDIYVQDLYEKWQNEIIIADEKSRLNDKYPEYRALLNEYRDGELLYQIMKDKVWDKALNDTSGLKTFFEENQKDYYWPERLHVHYYTTNDKDVADTIYRMLSDSMMSPADVSNEINKESQLNVTAKDKKVALDSEEFKELHINSQTIGLKAPQNVNDQYLVVNVIERLEKMPKKLNETRGQVIQDYQKFLEQSWIEELHEKFEVNVNKEVLYSLGDQ